MLNTRSRFIGTAHVETELRRIDAMNLPWWKYLQEGSSNLIRHLAPMMHAY
jgi:hypothetical protein